MTNQTSQETSNESWTKLDKSHSQESFEDQFLTFHQCCMVFLILDLLVVPMFCNLTIRISKEQPCSMHRTQEKLTIRPNGTLNNTNESTSNTKQQHQMSLGPSWTSRIRRSHLSCFWDLSHWFYCVSHSDFVVCSEVS